MLFLLTCMIIMQAHFVYGTEIHDKTSIERPRLVNALGSAVGEKISVNQQVQIMSDVRNNQDRDQKFVYIVQVKDSANRVVSLVWIIGDLNPNQSLSPAVSWTPQQGGEYVIGIFVWNSFEDQVPLSDSETIHVTTS